MQRFRVVCFDAGKWDDADARVVEAQDEQKAAELVCGAPLAAAGKPGHLRAQVSPVAAPGTKKMFYIPT